ncbi:NAD-dependent epimerase/dehydratase family protein [Paenibacillus sacheonensis]|uniref:NAD-dependent epimerase/dehydratase family protein n=1 Tax=Paenibacillus sacheonensis TaxID=742054 RepID=A0A7X5C0Y5_9BACL|nr:NAD-dependent epimerase/dehydratase family protein [Paenibacillus sacheonensis]MBM7565318.1 nucleoside-diphosphate-sugar epimerase [Paenibacillus sacheonensis]NBC69750.1 NAD-dependent epimerase/dehydratase family protein [Paenibacillus sacheonensis]
MRKVLVLGGTRFFGKLLVERLIAAGDDVTILTRGGLPNPFGDRVTHIQADRKDAEALGQALGQSAYDVVYDNICYLPEEAEEAVKLFAGRVGKYVVTSTLSVYPFGGPRKTEAMFEPRGYELPTPYPAEINYGEGKRLVEAVFLQKAPFPVAAARFPIVLGAEDYTRRLHFHVEHVQQGKPIGIPAPEAKLSFIVAGEAAEFLDWLGRSAAEGAYNACSSGDISPSEIVKLVEQATGKEASVAPETEAADMSPFGVPDDWRMDTAKAEAEGFVFRELDDWLPQLIVRLAQEPARG